MLIISNILHMNKIFLGAFLLFNLIVAPKAHSQTTPNEIILGIPMLTNKSYNQIKDSLNTIDGVTLLAYCESTKLFLMSFDPAKIKSGEEIARTLRTNFPNYEIEIKSGTNIAQIIDHCTRYPLNAAAEAR